MTDDQTPARRWWLIGLWVVLLIGYTVASGFTLPPDQGVADPEAAAPLGAAQLGDLLSSATGGLEVYSLTPALASHSQTDMLVVAAPERAAYDAEVQAIDTIMERGGTVLVFTTSTVWNPVLSDHGIQTHGEVLIPAANATRERLVSVELPEDLGAGSLLLPNATAIIDPGDGVRTVAPSQDMVLDENSNGTIEVPPDTAGTFPVIAERQVGDGRLIVVASVEAVLGTGIDRNLDALNGLVGALGTQGPVALDAGTHPRGAVDVARAPAQASLALAHWSPIAAGVLLLGAVGLVVQVPARPGGATDRPGLDDVTPHTREVITRGSDRS